MSESLTDRLYERLEAQIRSGALATGARLPSQKDVAAEEAVSRTVVREAFARLAAQGLTFSRQGSGVFVAEGARYRAFQVTREELSDLSDVIKLLEIRLAIETEMAAMAASRRTTADIVAIRDALNLMKEVSGNAEASARADAQFHLAIARATQNDYYVRIIDFLGIRLVPPRTLYLRDGTEAQHREYSALIHREHDDIFDGIVRMDPAVARECARRHMQESLNRHSRLSGPVD